MKIKFLGAARLVTGSCYLVKTDTMQFLVDCGMFQGVKEEELNLENFDFSPSSVNFVVLTHSHLDHCGLLPKLYKEGFRGKVYCSIPTRGIVEHMLLDSAKVQEIRHHEANEVLDEWSLIDDRNNGPELSVPLYDTTHVLGILDKFQAIDFDEEVNVNKFIKLKLLRVGHALGAASAYLTIKENNKSEKKLLFSGDIGNSNQRLDNRFDYVDTADFIIMESLYGNKYHEPRSEMDKKLAEIVNKTLSRGGNVIVPSFTYQRSQELLVLFKRLISSGEISNEVKIYLDSPLAIKVTNVYKRYFRYLGENIVSEFKNGERLFDSRNIEFLSDKNSSKGIRKRRGKVVIAGHGMCAGGRILFHLANNLSDRKSSIVFVGFQAPGTTGREIVEGAKQVMINEKMIKVQAEIHTLYGFSAHGDHADLMKWLQHIRSDRVNKVFLIHAEESTSLKFKKTIEHLGYNVIVPKMHEEYEL
ncbi:MAG: MBL fold metallo-hydrolase [Candidatus Dojkabacteria bacterium]|nr:MBL fold metallo-hydrolase [Candidatus Dojkabacteria bacterium]